MGHDEGGAGVTADICVMEVTLHRFVSGFKRLLGRETHRPPPNPRRSDTPIDFVILSYPRSGNHWVRYIIEWFSGRPTLGAGEGEHANDSINPIDTPIGSRVSIPHLVLDAPPIAKKRHGLAPWDSKEAGLLLIVRNYKECVVRQLQLTQTWGGSLDIEDGLVAESLRDYGRLIRDYDGWESRKHLLYYEDLVRSPKAAISALLEFMSIPASAEQASEFYEKYGWHKQNSISALVDPSATRGESIVSHSQRLTPEQRRAWDDFLAREDGGLFRRYLDRYREDAGQDS